jgi:hypothetical protein
MQTVFMWWQIRHRQKNQKRLTAKHLSASSY